MKATLCTMVAPISALVSLMVSVCPTPLHWRSVVKGLLTTVVSECPLIFKRKMYIYIGSQMEEKCPLYLWLLVVIIGRQNILILIIGREKERRNNSAGPNAGSDHAKRYWALSDRRPFCKDCGLDAN